MESKQANEFIIAYDNEERALEVIRSLAQQIQDELDTMIAQGENYRPEFREINLQWAIARCDELMGIIIAKGGKRGG